MEELTKHLLIIAALGFITICTTMYILGFIMHQSPEATQFFHGKQIQCNACTNPPESPYNCSQSVTNAEEPACAAIRANCTQECTIVLVN